MKKIVIIFIASILFFFSCVTGSKLKSEIDIEKQRLQVDEKRGAKQCAAYDLARAQAELDFAAYELEIGNYTNAEAHMAKEKIYAARSTKNADACIPKDKDGDGIVDDADQCPLEPGPERLGGCPDTDSDGILDKNDKCPTVPGVPHLHGCPEDEDSDGDGISDKNDHCPFEPEDLDSFEDEDGCPDPDNDQDGVLDKNDMCPMVKGPPTNQGCPVNDQDGDGVPDEIDSCPQTPEDIDGFEDQDGCPDPDNDQDGIPDTEDKCPDEAGPKENFGCPILDTDKDGVPDIVDKCPDEPEDIDGFEDEDGCPDLDNDSDGIPDLEDKCPLKPGVIEEQGCPKKYKLIVVTQKKIELKQKVFFKTGRAAVNKKSYEMLKEVADAIKSTPGIKKIIIEGHTDSRGGRQLNLRLSRERADAVKEFLVDEGVDENRLETVGYGPDRPVTSNRTRSGRAKNRRVEFKIDQ